MGRPPYGTVGGRRSGSAAWQWVIIGGVLGMGCSAIFVLSLLTFGVLSIEGVATEVAVVTTVAPPPTVDVQGTINAAIDATVAAQPPTQQAAQDVQPTSQGSVIVAPTATPFVTPTTEPTEDAVDVEQTEETDTTQPQNTTQQLGGQDSSSGVPERLQLIRSELARVDGGTFSMGTTPQEITIAVRECVDRDGGACEASMGQDSFPAHEVTLNPFFIEETEVTNQQYVEFLNVQGPGNHQNCDGFLCVETRSTNDNSVIVFDSQNYDLGSQIFANQPVVGVTWYGAKAYCEAIGRRLPTEAEWEYAARGPVGEGQQRYPWGDEWDVSYARTNRPDPTNVGVVDIRSYPLNVSQFGVVDMAGNAAEWVADWYSTNYYSQPEAGGLNPTGPLSGVERSVRGGSWDQPPFFARTVHRLSERPDNTQLWIGFRCAADTDDSATLPGTVVTQPAGALGTLPDTPPADDEPAATEPPNAAPTLPPLATAAPDTSDAGEATEVPAVPPGG